jgi:SIR2-like domain
MSFQLQKNDVILLLGAGASEEAGIPITIQMIDKITDLLENEWKEYKPLYEYITSQYKLSKNDINIFVNIEDLVNILDELLQLLEKEHPLSLFHLSWINFMENVGGYSATVVREFRKKIVDKLKEWIELDNATRAKYYQQIALFQKGYNNPFRIFTLNYDKCIEDTCRDFKNNDISYNCLIERGFGNEKEEDNIWNWNRFTDREEGNKEPEIYLYKMHGSIDWTRDKNEKLIHKASAKIENGKHEIIFGTRQKVKAYDPFLFFIYEFREYVLKSKIILICGYGFWDNHINDILKQGLEADPTKILIVNKYMNNKITKEEQQKQDLAFVKKQIRLTTDNKVVIEISKASDFFQSQLNIEVLNKNFPDSDLPF